MGTTFSTNQNRDFKNDRTRFLKIINDIASKLILTQTYDDFTKMGNEKYCSQIVDLTAKILNLNLNRNTVKQLYSHKFIDKLERSEKTKQLCYSISAFYVKVAQIFTAIVKVENPIKEYTDPFTNKKQYNEFIKLDAENNINVFKMNTTNNLCQRRLNSLMSIYTLLKDKKNVSLNNIRILCKYNKETSGKNNHKIIKNLYEEPGLMELQQLYDDIAVGITFNKKSKESKEQYQKDLIYFYKAFTNKEPEKKLMSFKDIPIDDFFDSKKFCKLNDLNTSIKNALFQEYLNQINKMKQDYSNYQQQLIKILKTIFIVQDGTKIVINPKLNIVSLNNIAILTRRTLMMLYVSCEQNFKQAIKIIEAITAENIRLKLQAEQKIKKPIQQKQNKENEQEQHQNSEEKQEEEKEEKEKEEEKEPGDPLIGDVSDRLFVNY
jgi:hypothetical protein